MNGSGRWSRVLVVVGLVAMLVGALDPLEGSVVILPGSALVALGAMLGKSRHRRWLAWSFVLLAVGIAVMFGLSAVGGLGGETGRSNLWAVLVLPYAVGWILGVVGAIRCVRERPNGSSALLLVASTGVLFSAPASAQDTIRVTIQGTVLDSRSGRPIPDVEVTLAELGVVLMTDSAGSFLLPDLALGTYRLVLQKGGYERVEGPLQVLRAGGMVIRLDPLAAAVGPTAATAVPGSSRIRGIVMDAGSGAPLEGALVTIEGVRRNQVTDADGRFALSDIPAGRRRLAVSLLGYATRTDSVTVPRESILTLDVALTVEPVPVAPITVSVESRNLDLELVGFYERQERERGIFFTQEKIEERNPITVVDLFEGLPGVRIVVRQGIKRAVALTGNRAMSLMDYSKGADPFSTPCYPAVWLNGMMVHAGADTVPEYIEDLANPSNVAGIEIYPSAARIPVQYNIAGACGVIVIWTRSGGGRERSRRRR